MSSIEYINSQIVISGVSSITFSNIPQNYTDLIMMSNIIGSTTAYPYLVINSVGGNISRLWLNGNGSSAGSNKLSDSYIVGGVNWNSSNNAFFTQTNFMNYSNLNIFKTFLTEVANSSVGVEIVVNTLRSLDPITSIQYVSSSGNLNPGSALSLWGVK